MKANKESPPRGDHLLRIQNGHLSGKVTAIEGATIPPSKSFRIKTPVAAPFLTSQFFPFGPIHSSFHNIRLSVKLLLVRLHVHVALQLSARRAELEAQLAVGSALVKLGKALHAAVLHRVLETSSEVGNELGDRSVKTVSKLLCQIAEVRGTYPLCATAPETP